LGRAAMQAIPAAAIGVAAIVPPSALKGRWNPIRLR